MKNLILATTANRLSSLPAARKTRLNVSTNEVAGRQFNRRQPDEPKRLSLEQCR